MNKPNVTINGFIDNEENKTFSKTEYRVTYTLDYEAMSDFEYWHNRERNKGVSYPTLADFRTEYEDHRKGAIKVIVWPADVPEMPYFTDLINRELKQKNWMREVPTIAKRVTGDKVEYVLTENGVEYIGTQMENMNGSLTTYWGIELGQKGNTPTIKDWYDSLSPLTRGVMNLSKHKLEIA